MFSKIVPTVSEKRYPPLLALTHAGDLQSQWMTARELQYRFALLRCEGREAETRHIDEIFCVLLGETIQPNQMWGQIPPGRPLVFYATCDMFQTEEAFQRYLADQYRLGIRRWPEYR